jgi:hypothetical protein
MLQRGDLVPHFDVRTTGGELFSYSSICQRKSLVLICLSATVAADEDTVAADEDYVRELKRHDVEFSECDSVCIVTRDGVPGLPAPGTLIADQWGEIVHVVAPIDVNALPAPRELLEWVEYIASRCPECDGEAK